MRRTGIWKRVVSGTLAAGLVVSVTACGGGEIGEYGGAWNGK